MLKQKITAKFKNSPRDVQLLLVPCSESLSLNKDQSLSVPDKAATVINAEGVQPSTRGLKVVVYTLSKVGTMFVSTNSSPELKTREFSLNKRNKKKAAYIPIAKALSLPKF
jgi:hypothetical protein